MAQEGTVPTSPQAPGIDLASEDLTAPTAGGVSSRIARHLVIKALSRLEQGSLTVIGQRGRLDFGCLTADFDVRGTIRVLDPAFYSRVVSGGSIGAGESWADGLWTSDDLTSVVRILARNRHVLDSMDGLTTAVTKPLDMLLHKLRDNTRGGSKRNIAAHYDLGNDFFALFLDPTMMYSSAVFPDWTARLDQAAIFKLDLIAKKLNLKPADTVVEIGTGWGGFAIHAARNYGCKVVTTTISRRQYEFSRRRVAEEGLAERVEVLFEDYRSLPQKLGRRFDKLVSIEMIEAVGHKHLPAFFATVDALLEPDGAALIQAITIRDHQYETYRRGVDFIQRHIFPGGLLPSVARMSDCLQKGTDMVMNHLEDIGLHYADTLAAWRKRFLANRDQISQLGLNQAFQRLWEFYFCYCEGAFRERSISAVQVMLSKPLNRSRPIATSF